MQKKLDETAAEILILTIANLRLQFSSDAKEIIVPFDIDYSEENISLTIPKAVIKKSY